MRFKLSIIIFLLIFLGCSSQQSIKKETGNINPPLQILKIMEESEIRYNIDIDENMTSNDTTKPIKLHNQYYIKHNGNAINLDEYNLSDDLSDSLNKAEKLFQNGQYKYAKKLYQYIYKKDTTYNYALTLIGDVFFMQGDLEKAKYYFKKSISKNFIDYSAHWFLADAYWKSGETKKAVKEITLAHIFNVNHEKLKKKLIYYRSETGNKFNNWIFKPIYSVSKQNGKVKIRFKMEWMGYAFVKAIWKYEPDYCKNKIGKSKKESEYNTLEEKEAILSYLVMNKEEDHINNIVMEGYIIEFILYEIIAKKYPRTLLLLPKDQQEKLFDYVNKYH